MQEQILIADFGSQYTQLIARRIRELNVYCEIHPFHQLPGPSPEIKGIILSGSPCSVRDPNCPNPDLGRYRNKIPVLGVCYGAQLLAQQNGGQVMASETREYGRANLAHLDGSSQLFKGVSEKSQVWMSHGDTIITLPDNFKIIASTGAVHVAAFEIQGEATFGIQFHPEVTHSEEGPRLIENFVKRICKVESAWTPESFIEKTVGDLRQQIGTDKVVMALSGGVDSTVAAVLLHKAIGQNLHCIFVDNGVLRKGEFEEVTDRYSGMGLNIHAINASSEFYAALKGKVDPEEKRKAIGRTFIEIFDREAHKIEGVKWLGQGTIYPDVIESAPVKGPSATIKSHHNVGGLPEKMHLKVVEPLRMLFKDEVRRIGYQLGIDPNILERHPFPGPGLGIRILGEITPEKVNLLQEADHIYTQRLKAHQLYTSVWQAGAILLPIQSVGVMGDERTYEQVVALRAVTSIDGMTADWAHLPYDFLAEVSNEIINRVRGINRVVYDISSKPPATIEWE